MILRKRIAQILKGNKLLCFSLIMAVFSGIVTVGDDFPITRSVIRCYFSPLDNGLKQLTRIDEVTGEGNLGPNDEGFNDVLEVIKAYFPKYENSIVYSISYMSGSETTNLLGVTNNPVSLNFG